MTRVKKEMNKYEWTKDVDAILEEKVVKNHFNFEKIAADVNSEMETRKISFGAHKFNPQKCRIRWAYIHLKRKMKSAIKYPKFEAPAEVIEKLERQIPEPEKDASDKEN